VSYADARNEATGFQQELIRAEGQRRDAKHRAVRANLEGTIVWLQNEASGKRSPW
jgi:hypothetical protein